MNNQHKDLNDDRLTEMNQRLERIENLLSSLQLPRIEKYFFSTSEAASRLGLSPWYIRRLCSMGEILAEKHPESGRYLIASEELERLETRRGAMDE